MEKERNKSNVPTRRNKGGNRIFKPIILLLILILCIFVAVKAIGALSDHSSSNTENSVLKTKLNPETLSDPKDSNNNIDKTAWNLILVNPWNKISDNFSVELTKLQNGQSIDKRAYPQLQQMMDDARAEGLSPIICSSYRSKEKQQSLFDNQIQSLLSQEYSKKEAEIEAAKWVAVPGTSEHHTGLAVDIVAQSYQSLNEEQEKTPEQKWLMKNSYKYGFILRYPKSKSDITGIVFEPWHYRYVGKKIAKEIFEKEICLEEFLNVAN